MIIEVFYHGSAKINLSMIKPNKSTHGKNYIYATKYRIIALLFLARWNDFLLTLQTEIVDNKLKITLTERYENAIYELFNGKSGVIYTLKSDNFKQEKNLWEYEYISDQEEKPISSEMINNILDEIKILNQKGDLDIYYYPNRPLNIPIDDSDMIDKCIELYRLSGNISNATFCIERFPKLRKQIVQVFKEQFDLEL